MISRSRLVYNSDGTLNVGLSDIQNITGYSHYSHEVHFYLPVSNSFGVTYAIEIPQGSGHPTIKVPYRSTDLLSDSEIEGVWSIQIGRASCRERV